MAKPHSSVGKEDSPRKKVIPKDPRWTKKKGDNITIQDLDYGVDDYIRGSMKKEKSPCSRVVDCLSFLIFQT